jgi:AraC family L-rhamnose operon transcriptional activator RhaR/AraC family L-rhamnose operon regulatory protein RhaS
MLIPDNDIKVVERHLERFWLYVMPYLQPAMARHSHSFNEFVYVRSGTGKHWHHGNTYPIFSGDCFIILPNEIHGYDSTENLNIINMLFTIDALQRLSKELSSSPGFIGFFATEPLFRHETEFCHKLHLTPAWQEEIEGLFKGIIDEQRTIESASETMRKALFLHLVVSVSRSFENSLSTPRLKHEFAAKKESISKAIAYVEKHYNSDMSVSDVANFACLSESRLAHVFKESAGMSLTDYLNHVRLEKARRLLGSTTRPISSICYDVGFHDPAYFSRLFVREYEVSPKEYRKKRNAM